MKRNIIDRIRKFYFLSFLLLSFSSKCEVFIFNDTTAIYTVDKYILMLEDKTNSLTINDIIKSNKFKQNNSNVPNLGVSQHTWWIKITVKNTSNKPSILLKVDAPTIDEIDFFQIKINELIHIKSGEYKLFSARKYNDPNYIFDLKIPKDQTRTIYLKIKSGEQIMLPILIGSPYKIFESITQKDFLFGIYIGIIFSMLLYNIFIYFTIKDNSYLYYVIYILFVGLTQTFLHGYTFKYIWPNVPWLAIHSMYLLPSFVGIAIAEFVKVFLQVKEHSIFLYKGLNAINLIYIICIVLAILGYHNLSQNIIHVNAMLIALFALFVAYRIAKKGHRPAKFFLFAWSIFLVGVCVFILKDLGILPYNNITVYMMPVGTAIEVILISFALADRINILKKEKEQSQAQALEILKENERITKEQNIILEKKVNERTTDLKKTNAELSKTLDELKETQSQLVNSEKMASLGQLTAGVAHEINNPINFVVSNINPLRRDINDIKELLGKYDSLKNDDTYNVRLGEIEKFKKEIDYNYVQDEIEILLKGISEGATRTSEIVKSLKNFSRLDENDLKKTNINEGISSSIVLLSQQIDTIKVIQNLGQIPEIECFPGKINQAFMNILTNAIEAIHSHRKDGGVLEIHTYQQDEYVVATIKDNGTGMPEEVINKIFEPFYTTKDVGKGTGLGLSITHGIIEKHHGTISIQSEIGNGTTFEIKLPIHAPKL